jgi:hypothetical protein
VAFETYLTQFWQKMNGETPLTDKDAIAAGCTEKELAEYQKFIRKAFPVLIKRQGAPAITDADFLAYWEETHSGPVAPIQSDTVIGLLRQIAADVKTLLAR